MPQGRSGLSATTNQHMVLDAGEVWLNISIPDLEDGSASDPWGDATSVSGAVKLGGTRGGNEFNLNRVIRQMPVDGAIGPIKGFNRRQTSAPTLTCNMLEWTAVNLHMAIAAANKQTAGSFEKITGGEVEDSDYFSNIALATTYKGNPNLPIVVVLFNPLVLEAPSASFVDEDESVLTAVFAAHVTSSTPNTEAWAIYHPGLPTP